MPIIVSRMIPRNAPGQLLDLQNQFLSEAESVLGSRDRSKIILGPEFTDKGYPHIFNMSEPNAVRIHLTDIAASDWNAAKSEMAHEVVHLLNPISGNTNKLEEGVAVVFSIYAQSLFQFSNPTLPKPYGEALSLICRLSQTPLEAARLIRERVGALSRVRAQDLRELFPSVEENVVIALVETFDGNS